MSYYNEVILMGQLGKIEVKQINKDKQVVNFSMFTKESRKDKNGKWENKFHWFNCYSFSENHIKYFNDYLMEKDHVFIKGSLDVQTFEKDGKKQNSIKIKVDIIKSLESKKEKLQEDTNDFDEGDEIPF